MKYNVRIQKNIRNIEIGNAYEFAYGEYGFRDGAMDIYCNFRSN